MGLQDWMKASGGRRAFLRSLRIFLPSRGMAPVTPPRESRSPASATIADCIEGALAISTLLCGLQQVHRKPAQTYPKRETRDAPCKTHYQRCPHRTGWWTAARSFKSPKRHGCEATWQGRSRRSGTNGNAEDRLPDHM